MYTAPGYIVVFPSAKSKNNKIFKEMIKVLIKGFEAKSVFLKQ